MRILFCTSYPYLGETRGGLQTTLDELCLFFRERDVEVAVLCGSMDARKAPARDETHGYPVIRAADPLAALPLVCAAYNPTLIFVQSGYRLVPMVLAALETGVPTSVYLHNVENHRLDGILAPDPRLLYFANSDFTAARWNALFGIRCHVLPPVVLPDRYMAKETGQSVLFVNPVPEKGIERVAELAALNPDIPFLIAESWNIGDDWRAWLDQRFGHMKNVTWRKATSDTRELFAEARILLMPSVWEEAYGRVATEAQINGLPVLASNRGALPDTVGAGGKVLDIHASPEVWTQALRSLYFDRQVWNRSSDASRKNANAQLLVASHAFDEALFQLALHESAGAPQ